MSDDKIIKLLVKVMAFAVLSIFLLTITIPIYKVWTAKMEGEAKLAHAEQERQIIVARAKAEQDAAEHTAAAIRIVGEMAQKYPEYRQQEYIQAFAEALTKGSIDQIVYVATEAGIPILESSRLTHAR
jgi:regulator of protease activity HflC (stomatin/prohibitin superfamily)